ncbi:TPA: hypothetical protein N0F65_005390 [Lagenidium giganteum]|uniref:Calmodulin n=1 Tax=Lagenidium giganteum TaxID=4803 RepID=A0AAV2Z296_9STRA|nr:TPA: hypothetical protein N0F65_005390 [Lagenidium giganteum]
MGSKDLHEPLHGQEPEEIMEIEVTRGVVNDGQANSFASTSSGSSLGNSGHVPLRGRHTTNSEEVFVRGTWMQREFEAAFVEIQDPAAPPKKIEYGGKRRRWPGVLLLTLVALAVAGALAYGGYKTAQSRQRREDEWSRDVYKSKHIGGGSGSGSDLISDDGQIGNPKEYPPSQCALPNYLSKNGQIVAVAPNGTEVPISIKGVNWFGMETGQAIPLGLWDNSMNGTTAYQIATFLSENEFNAVRLPVCADFLLTNKTPNTNLINKQTNRAIQLTNYMTLLQSIVKVLQYRNIGVLVSMHTLTATEIGSLWYSETFTEDDFLDSIDALTDGLCSHEYWNVMGVDLKNEPYKATWGTSDTTDFRTGAQRIANRMLKGCPQWMGFVEGLNYKSHTVDIGGESFTYNDWYGGGLQDVAQYPLKFGVAEKVVWAPHYYTPAVFPQLYMYGGGTRDTSDQTLKAFVELSDRELKERINGTMYDMFGYLASKDGPALLLGEFGGLYTTDLHPNKTTRRCTDFTMELAIENGYAGGFMWSLNPESKYQYNPASVGGPVATFPEGLMDADWMTTNSMYLEGLTALNKLPNLRRFPCFSMFGSHLVWGARDPRKHRQAAHRSTARRRTTTMAGGASEEWVDVQKQTFTRWANTYLSRKRMQIDDLYEDLKDGIRLISLLQIICREKVCRKFNKKPRMRIQKMENLNFAFAFMQKKNVNVTNIGSSDILDGNNKLVLGLMWTLIKSFQVAEIDVEGVSGKDGLLLWVNRSLADYKSVEVKNFSSSWSDGMAFCALIHRFYPNSIEFDKLNPANAEYNVKLAFDTAQEKFKIPQLLNVADVAGHAKPDEKSIMTYVSLLFKEFASGQQKKKAVTTISKAVNIAQRHQDLSNEYGKSAGGLLEWLTTQTERFETITYPRRLNDIKEALAAHMDYKTNEKPPREAEYVAVEGCAGRWVSSCKNNNREIPVLNPPVERLQELKSKLDDLESSYELKLRTSLESFQKTEVYLTKVMKELEKIEGWAKEKESSVLFEEGLVASTTSEAEEKLESLAFIQEVELPRYKSLVESVTEHSKDLSADHSETTSTMERVEAMQAFVATVEGKIDDTKKRVEEALRAQQEMDAVVKDCKVLMRSLKYAIEEMDEEVESASKTEGLSKSGVMQAKEHFDSVLIPKVQQAIVVENETLQEKKETLAQAGRVADVNMIEKFHTRVQKLLDTCQEKLKNFEEELANVERRDEVCREFAELSGKFKERCTQSTQSLNNIEGSLSDQFSTVVDMRHSLFRQQSSVNSMLKEEEPAAADDAANGEKPQELLLPLTTEMERLEKVNEELERLRVFSNPYTTDTIHSLRAQFTSLENAVRDKVKSLEKEVALSQLGNLTPQQITEIKEVFKHFDLDHDGVLARDEFIMACKGLGFALSDDDCHDHFDKMDEEDNDEISFDKFSNFCAEQLQSGSSKSDVETAFEILTGENLTMEKIEEQFEPNLVEFIKKNQEKLMSADGQTLDLEKFSSFVFSL